MKKRNPGSLAAEIIGWIVAVSLFVLPFLFVAFNSLKDRRGANKLNFTPPDVFHWENYVEVIRNNRYQILTAFKNSAEITFFSLIVLVGCSAMAGYIIQRRRTRVTAAANKLLLVGLMVPVSILPTIWLLRSLNIYKTLFSMVMIESALNLPFTIMLYRGFMDTIPTELEEAAWIDGCNKWAVFSRIIFPLLKPVTSTVIILNAVTIFNDFTNPLYFYPSNANVTVQLTIYNYISQFQSSYNLLFADVILITLPMLLLFIIFNKRIISGMVSGAVKG
ncbi:MAG: carbohydrate ABC transporter permease [Clostridiales bacterium]|nr:carbohydrate ABC transporter permease [Bacillota bacterium]NLL54381.1 carbohydrate ABC transporter permease [Clostridiales bacterium]